MSPQLLATMMFLVTVCSPALAVDCTNEKPVDCYTKGTKEVEQALGRFKHLEDNLNDLAREVKKNKDDVESLIAGLTQEIKVLEANVPSIVAGHLQIIVRASGFQPPDAHMRCEGKEILIGGSCIGSIGTNIVAIGPVFEGNFPQKVEEIRCQRFSGEQLVEAFAICMRLPE